MAVKLIIPAIPSMALLSISLSKISRSFPEKRNTLPAKPAPSAVVLKMLLFSSIEPFMLVISRAPPVPKLSKFKKSKPALSAVKKLSAIDTFCPAITSINPAMPASELLWIKLSAAETSPPAEI